MELPVLAGWFRADLFGWNLLTGMSGALPAEQSTACGGVAVRASYDSQGSDWQGPNHATTDAGTPQ